MTKYKITWIRLGLLMLFAAGGSAVTPATGRADIPHIINWQAVALDSNGVAIDDQIYTMHFRIFDDGAGGNLLWAENFKSVFADHGLINAFLGDSIPIPDSVFGDIPRYLEVEFDGELPFARIELQSVAYAFRVGSLDGAQGGRISSDIELASASTTPAVVMFREGTSTIIGWLRGDSDGGDLRLYDGTEFPTILLYPTGAEGGSGNMELFTRESPGGTGIVFTKTGQDNPFFWGLGMVNSMAMAMDSVGDPAVEWPVDGVSAPEIVAEPGISSSLSSLTSTTFYTSLVTLSSSTITTPDSGYVVVMSGASFRNLATNNYMNAILERDGSAVASWWMDAGDLDLPSPWTDQRQTATYTGAVGPGTYTFAFRAAMNVDSARASYAKVTVMYFPKAYGTVNAPAPPLASQVGPNGEQLSRVDRPHDAEASRRASEAFVREQKLREMQALQQQIEELQARYGEHFQAQASPR